MSKSIMFRSPESIVAMFEKISSEKKARLIKDGTTTHKLSPRSTITPGRGHNLESDINRDLDIECGKGLEVIDQLPQLDRQLVEDSDLRVTFDKETGKPIRIVAKRDPEFVDGQEVSVATIWDWDLDQERKLEASEDIMDMAERGEVELLSIENEYRCPKDKWDLLYDAQEFVSWYRATPFKSGEEVNDRADTMIYSAWAYPRMADKTKHHPWVKSLAQDIMNDKVTRGGLWKKLATTTVDLTPQQKLVIKGKKILESEEAALKAAKQELVLTKNAELRTEIQETTKRINAGIRWFKNLKPSVRMPSLITSADKAYLWGLWTQNELSRGRKVKMPKWQMENYLRNKNLPEEEIEAKLAVLFPPASLTQREEEEIPLPNNPPAF